MKFQVNHNIHWDKKETLSQFARQLCDRDHLKPVVREYIFTRNPLYPAEYLCSRLFNGVRCKSGAVFIKAPFHYCKTCFQVWGQGDERFLEGGKYYE